MYGTEGLMKNPFLLFLLLLIVLGSFAGCKSEKDAGDQVSPAFKSGSYTLQGIEGKIGILSPGFKANFGNKYMWHFWGTKEELSRVPFRVEAIDLKSGNKHQALLTGMGTAEKKHVWEYESRLGGPNNGADAHLPSGMELPHAGKWKLNAYLGGELFGSVVVEVSP